MLPSTPNLLYLPRAKVIAVGPYVGPGDLATFQYWYGLRGYSAAYSIGSNPAIDIVDQAGANQLTVNILSNGSLDVASIATWVTAHSVTTILVKKLYDQSVNATHLSQATAANMPALILNGVGSLPVLRFNGSAPTKLQGSGGTLFNQPYSVVAAYKQNAGSGDPIFFGDEGGIGLGWKGSASQVELYAPTVLLSGDLSNGVIHSVIAVANSTSSKIFDNGSSTSGDAGTANFNNSTILIGSDVYGNNATGDWVETGLVLSDVSSVAASLTSNARGYWGV